MLNAIKEILESAIQAPSGENSQPWEFKIRDNHIIEVYNIPTRDKSLYNFQQQGAYVAHGALIENILIASSQLGYRADLKLFPEESNKNLISIFELSKSIIKNEVLYPYIKSRVTNRKPYEITPLTNEQKAELKDVVKEVGDDADIRFVEDREKIASLARALSTNERIIFENFHLHNFFFGHINWNADEDFAKKVGFYIKTLELSPQVQKGFSLFKHWRLLQILNKVAGVSKKAASENAKLYTASGALGVVLIKSSTPKDFISAGRIMQRIWLKATKMGLSIQPVTGVIFLMRRISAENTDNLSPDQVEHIKEAYDKIRTSFNVEGETIAMLFRVGVDGDPSARSSRISLHDVMKSNMTQKY